MGKKISWADENYKETLAAFMQEINPKPTLEQIKALKEMYKNRRKETSVHIEEIEKY